jgi:single-strand DNA-binding protein
MFSLNKVQLIATFGRDPEVHANPGGARVAVLHLATGDGWRDKESGEWEAVTDWHRVVLFGRLADVAGDYLAKGTTIYVEGKLKTRRFIDQGGIERYLTEVHATTLGMLGGKRRKEGGPADGETLSDTAGDGEGEGLSN